MEWSWPSAAAIAEAVQRRYVSAVEVTRSHLERIAALDGQLHSFLHLDEGGALAAAAAVDDRLARGETLPLAGVPVGLKDNLVTRGMPTTAGSQLLAGWIPPYDATVVERLRGAGAVLLGKLNLDEFAMGSSNEGSAFGPTRNPWDLERVPGGSSGGPAAAVAAGLVALALGSDTGGSIRQPAALCGVVGLKPTYGRVSRHGLVAYASSLDQIGPLGRRVLDCALALEVIAGHDPHDATSLAGPVAPYRAACAARALDGLRVGVAEEAFAEGLDPRIGELVRAALSQLQQLGARLVPVTLPSPHLSLAAYYLIAPAEASSNLARYDGIRYGRRQPTAGPTEDLGELYRRTRSAGFGAEVKRRILLGTFALRAGYYDAYYARAQKIRAMIRDDFHRAFAACDVIATPTSPVPAFLLGERTADPLAMYLADVYTISCNLAGLPGLSVPCGLVDDRLPAGLQLLGPPLGEEVLLRVAAAYEQSVPFADRHPPFAAVVGR